MLNTKSHNYIIITACKNEEDNLPKLIESVLAQTVKPVLWVIIDDGSTDRTPEILEKAKKTYKWIKSIRLGSSTRDLGLHYANILRKGFEFAIEYCKRNEINYEYLANIDGDIILEYVFFENLIAEFEKDPLLGVASGGIYHYVGEELVCTNARESEPSGANLMIRKKCFEECGGIPLSYAVDSAFNTKAKLRGWKTRCFNNIIAIEIRDTSTAEGYWKGYVFKGKAAYYLNFNPLHVIFKSLMYFFKSPFYIGIAYLYGYIGSVILNKEQIRDEEIKYYYKRIRPREIKQYYIDILKNKLEIKWKR